MNEKEEPRRGPLASDMAGAVSVGANMLSENMEEMSHDAYSKKLRLPIAFP